MTAPVSELTHQMKDVLRLIAQPPKHRDSQTGKWQLQPRTWAPNGYTIVALVNRGYIVPTGDNDGLRRYYALTMKGEATMNAISPKWREWLE